MKAANKCHENKQVTTVKVGSREADLEMLPTSSEILAMKMTKKNKQGKHFGQRETVMTNTLW